MIENTPIAFTSLWQNASKQVNHMTEYQVESYDVAVIGAGHAGIEAALAAEVGS